MGLDVPDLDDRDYEDLLEDARKRIPVHAEEWTDHNVHDPGITILELLAWLAESYNYQLDRVTDDHRRKYLELAGVELQPPDPATVRLSLDVPDGLDGRELAAGEQGVFAATSPGDRTWFRTDEDLTLSGASVAGVVCADQDGWTDRTTANDRDGMHYLAFGEDPEAGDALYLGFDADPFVAAGRLDLWVDFHDEDLPDPASHGDEAVEFEPSHRLVWEHCTAPNRWRDDEAWEPVTDSTSATVTDETNALYTGGRVRIPAPDPDRWQGTAMRITDRGRKLYWLRCRLARLDPPDPEVGPCDPSDGVPDVHYEVPPRLDAVATNVVRATHRRPVADETVTPTTEVSDGTDSPASAGESTTADGEATRGSEHGNGNGTDGPGSQSAAGPAPESDGADGTGSVRTGTSGAADQQYAVERPPVLEATVRVGGREWDERPDFDASGPDDRHYVLDRESGTVTFGDGRRGAIPDPGQEVTVSYVHGGGPGGNVPAGAEWQFEATALENVGVTPREPPSGGRGAETVEEGLARARERRRVPYRAVTASDHRYVATHTPGLRFGRAAVVENPGGESGRTAAAGNGGADIRVVVVPYSPPGRRPVPSRGFLDAVEGHLRRHCLLTERVDVAAPTYVGVDIGVEVWLADGVPPGEPRRQVRERIETFLDPLDGFEGDGWPFGRPVYRSEIYELLEGMDTVEDVADVAVATRGEGSLSEGTVLPVPSSVEVAIRDEGERCGRGF